MNIYYVKTTVSWVEQIDPEIGGPRFEEDDAAIIAAPSRGSAWSHMLRNAREAGYSLDFTSKHSVQLLVKDVDRAAGFVTDGEEAERYWVAAGRPVATDIQVVCCELCGGAIIDGECDTCESRYVRGKRVPDEYDRL